MRTTLFVSPSDIERETGLGKDQLRKWRQRYNFPPIELTADGKAAYSRKTVDQLCLIKRLILVWRFQFQLCAVMNLRRR
jgi:DNA-binding transcriptional MerR regulator